MHESKTKKSYSGNLEAKGITYKYNGCPDFALKNFSLRLSPGEIVGLYGTSGIGKTTLAKLLTGYLVPQEGDVLLNGEKLPDQGYSPVQLIFQHPELTVNPRWKARKILNEGTFLNQGSGPSDKLLTQLGIDSSWLDRYPHELSGGELQRLSLARVLGPETRFLIADEMTSMLDANTQACIWQAVMTYRKTCHMGVLVISHDRSLLNRLCSRLIDLGSVEESWNNILRMAV